jgi:hypothetical protein
MAPVQTFLAQNDAMDGIVGFHHTSRYRLNTPAIAGSCSFLNFDGAFGVSSMIEYTFAL